MGLFDNVKNAGVRTKLKGEIAMLEHEMTTHKKKFGVDLYDLMVKIHGVGSDGNKLTVGVGKMFHAKQSLFQEDWKIAHREIQDKLKQKEMKQNEIFRLEAKSECALPAISATEKMKQASQWMTDKGSTTKLMAEMASLDREVRLRKEQFGLDIFDAVVILGENSSSQQQQVEEKKKSKTPIKKGFGGLKKAVSKQLSAVSSSEKEVEAMIQVAKQDATFIQKQIDRKEKEISSLS
mmetsp:Transcript_8205/g.11842  ORF Transcript_8205/g.11842 Transcript_8205/m.11842 type:complete len:236 (+) Transcript_8205:164-871(+)